MASAGWVVSPVHIRQIEIPQVKESVIVVLLRGRALKKVSRSTIL